MFSVKHNWRHKIRLCSRVTIGVDTGTGPFPTVGSHFQNPYKLSPFERPYRSRYERFTPSFGNPTDDDDDDDDIDILAIYDSPCN